MDRKLCVILMIKGSKGSLARDGGTCLTEVVKLLSLLSLPSPPVPKAALDAVFSRKKNICGMCYSLYTCR